MSKTLDVRERFYTVEQLGPKQELTPEGFLLCRDVPIGRTGSQIYGPNETPITVGPNGLAIVDRPESQVFRPETIESANGKSLVNEHPEGDVDPSNWKTLTDGIMLHPRRGTGDQSDLLVADILVCDKHAIGLVQAGKVELSLGYTCDYTQTGVGRGEQSDIVINHVALVDKGRCGERCSIGDKAFGGNKVAKLKDSIIKAFKTGDKAKLDKLLAKVTDAEVDPDSEVDDPNGINVGTEGGDTHVHVHAPEVPEPTVKRWTDDDLDDLDQRLAACEEHMKKTPVQDEETEEEEAERVKREEEAKAAAAADEMGDDLEEEAPEGTGDKARKARDSAFLVDSFQATVAIAEIIHPGVKIPTVDKAASPKSTLDSLCKFRRSVLTLASNTADRAEIVKEVNGGRTLTTDSLGKMSCSQVRTLFNGVGAAVKRQNTSDSRMGIASPIDANTKPKSMAEIAKTYDEFWKQQR